MGSQGEGKGLGMKGEWSVDDNTFKNVGSQGGKRNKVKKSIGLSRGFFFYLFIYLRVETLGGLFIL